MEFSWRILTCPNCKRAYNWHIDSLLHFIKTRSGLGPQRFRCSACGAVFDSNLQEWRQMGMTQKLRYGFLSILYAGFISVSLQLPINVIIYKTHLLASASFNNLVVISVTFFAILVILLQILRIILSNSRSELVIPEPMNVSFWNWQTNLQALAGVICLIGDIIFAVVFVAVK